MGLRPELLTRLLKNQLGPRSVFLYWQLLPSPFLTPQYEGKVFFSGGVNPRNSGRGNTSTAEGKATSKNKMIRMDHKKGRISTSSPQEASKMPEMRQEIRILSLSNLTSLRAQTPKYIQHPGMTRPSKIILEWSPSFTQPHSLRASSSFSLGLHYEQIYPRKTPNWKDRPNDWKRNLEEIETMCREENCEEKN